MTTEKTLILLASKVSINKIGTPKLKTLTTKTSLLFIGANGSGKTRLGTWIEIESPQNQKHRTHRISAHKSLSMLRNE